MRLLLDTFAVLLALRDPEQLRAEAREALADAANEVWFSPVNVWEVEIKVSIGKLAAPAVDLAGALVALGAQELVVNAAHARAAGRLPLFHKDPFDRMLIAQALVEGLTLVTADEIFRRYSVDVLPA